MLNASWVVQAVVVLLVVVSVISWAAIFRKVFALKRVRNYNDDFERDFWSGTNLNDLYASAAQNAKHGGPMERIFASGMREYQKLRERRIPGRQAILIEKRETGLAIKHIAGIENRDPGIVQICGQQRHDGPAVSPPSCAESACRWCSSRCRIPAVPAPAAAGGRGT